jgi:hypothetical protein
MNTIRHLVSAKTWTSGIGVPLLATVISLAVIGGVIQV